VQYALMSQEARSVLDRLLATGREIWREGDDILISPPLPTTDQQINRLRLQLIEHKAQILRLLPSERPGPQRI
jgi:hypothetical protein